MLNSIIDDKNIVFKNEIVGHEESDEKGEFSNSEYIMSRDRMTFYFFPFF